MKIDVYTHFLPPVYFEALHKKTKCDLAKMAPYAERPILRQIELMRRAMDRFPDVMAVLTVASPPLEDVVSPSDAVELAKMANDELCAIVDKYPDKFIAGVACLPLSDVDAAIREADRTITELHFRGVQIFTNIGGEPVDVPRLRPLYERMVQHDLPIWIHPWYSPIMGSPSIANDFPKVVQDWVPPASRNAFGWAFETSVAMLRLVHAGVFQDYPTIKFITHCGQGQVARSLDVGGHLADEPLDGLEGRDRFAKLYPFGGIV